MKNYLLPLCTSFFIASGVNAAVYKMDFNTVGSSSAGSSWNVYAAPGNVTGPLKDTTESTDAGISVSTSGDLEDSTGTNLYNDNGPAWLEVDSSIDNAADNFFWTGLQTAANDGTSFTISFAGLTPGDTASIDLFASRSFGAVLTAFYEYSLDGSTWEGFTVLENTGSAATTDGWNINNTQTQLFNMNLNGDGYGLGRYMNASSLTLTGTTLDVRLTLPDASDWAGINAMQLTVIPEPSSILMVALGFIGILGYKRRKKTAAKQKRFLHQCPFSPNGAAPGPVHCFEKQRLSPVGAALQRLGRKPRFIVLKSKG